MMCRALITALLPLTLAVSAASDALQAADTSLPGEDGSSGNPLVLSLDACVRLALKQNEDIAVASYAVPIGEATAREAWGIFDPLVSASVGYSHSTASSLGTTLYADGTTDFNPGRIHSSEHDQRAAFSGLLPLGMTYSFALAKGNSVSRGGHTDGWSRELSLTVPLLRDAGRTTLTEIRLARNERDAARIQLKLEIIDSVAAVTRAYWNAVEATETLRVSEAALANARKLLANNETRYRIGVAASTDVEQSKAGVSQRESEVIAARSRLHDAQDALRRTIGFRPEDAMAERRLVLEDTPSLEGEVPNVQDSLASARARRLELNEMRLMIDSAETDRRRAFNATLPAANIVARRVQTDQDLETRTLDHLYWEDSHGTDYSIGLEASFPLGNIRAQNAYKRSRLNLSRTKEMRARTMQQIEWDVLRATREVETSHAQALKYAEIADLRRGNLASEEKLLAVDMSSSYRVIQMQDDLVNSELQAVRARIGFEEALVDLHVARGTLLDWIGVVVDDSY